jgi:serine/threonine protein kinase
VSGSFAPRPGEKFAGRHELKALLRGSGATWAFAARDHHAGRDISLLLFDPARSLAPAWAEFAQVVALARAARIPGLGLPQDVGVTPPTPLCCIAEPQVGDGFDRLREREGPLPWRRALGLGERVARVLEAAHAATLVGHRALTAGRCIAVGPDEVLVLDYGVAELEPEEGRPDDAGYRAPEQESARGDHRSDIYALAAILYELICGKRPSLRTPPCLRALVPGVPQAVDELFVNALARDAARRFHNIGAMRARMRELLGLAPDAGPDEANAEYPRMAPQVVPMAALGPVLSTRPLAVAEMGPEPSKPASIPISQLLAVQAPTENAVPGPSGDTNERTLVLPREPTMLKPVDSLREGAPAHLQAERASGRPSDRVTRTPAPHVLKSPVGVAFSTPATDQDATEIYSRPAARGTPDSKDSGQTKPSAPLVSPIRPTADLAERTEKLPLAERTEKLPPRSVDEPPAEIEVRPTKRLRSAHDSGSGHPASVMTAAIERTEVHPRWRPRDALPERTDLLTVARRTGDDVDGPPHVPAFPEHRRERRYPPETVRPDDPITLNFARQETAPPFAWTPKRKLILINILFFGLILIGAMCRG